MSLTLTTHFYDIFFNQQNILLPESIKRRICRYEFNLRCQKKRSFRQAARNLSLYVKGGVMNEHRSFIITSFTIFILLSCFIPQSEGRTLLTLNKIFAEPICYEWYVDHQHPLIHLLFYNCQNIEPIDYTPFYSNSVHFFFYTEISYILEKRCVFSKWNQYVDTSQRPPPLYHDQLYI